MDRALVGGPAWGADGQASREPTCHLTDLHDASGTVWCPDAVLHTH